MSHDFCVPPPPAVGSYPSDAINGASQPRRIFLTFEAKFPAPASEPLSKVLSGVTDGMASPSAEKGGSRVPGFTLRIRSLVRPLSRLLPVYDRELPPANSPSFVCEYQVHGYLTLRKPGVHKHSARCCHQRHHHILCYAHGSTSIMGRSWETVPLLVLVLSTWWIRCLALSVDGLATRQDLSSILDGLELEGGKEVMRRADPSLAGYLGVFFLGADPYVYFYLSNGNNPLSLKALNRGAPVMKPTKGTGGVRDPTIVPGGGKEAGKKWYIIGTDLHIGKVPN